MDLAGGSSRCIPALGLALVLAVAGCPGGNAPGPGGGAGGSAGGSGGGGPMPRGGRGGTGVAGSGGSGQAGAGGSGGTTTGTGDAAGAGAGGAGGGAGAAADSGSPEVAPADTGGSPDAAPAGDAAPAADGAPAGDKILPPAAPGSPDPIGSGWTEIFPAYKMDQPPGQVRYTLTDGEFHLWLFNTDASTYPGRDSGPRSELHIRNNYSTGQAQYQADIKIDPNCSGVSLMQVFGGASSATSFMAFISGDSLTHYSSETIVAPIRNRWFRLNVTHDTATRAVVVYIDGQRKGSFTDHGAATHYFKCGLYHQRNMTARCDAWFKNIRVFKQ
jgi:hypothetical protein